MDYTAPYAKERLTGRADFQATGQTNSIDLGNVVMTKIDFGIKRKEHFGSRRGILTLDRQDAYASQAVWTITLDEFVGPTLGYAWLGTVNANVSQGALSGSTFAFTSAKGAQFKSGKYGLFTASLTTPGSKVEGYSADYVIDRATGIIYIPLGSSIANLTACTMTYSCPALTYDSVTALQVLNRPGTLTLFQEDDSGSNVGGGADAVPPVRYTITVPCILSTEDGGDFKADDYRQITIKAVATSAMTINRLQ